MISSRVFNKIVGISLVMILLLLLTGDILGTNVANAGEMKKISPTLKKVQQRGYLRCGVTPVDMDGFRLTADNGQLEGFDIEFCKAIAAAIFNDDSPVQYVIPLDWDGRFTILTDGDADVVFAIASITTTRDSGLGVDFPANYHYEYNPDVGLDILSPVVAHGDQQWADLVRWVVYGMITAEELGVDSVNVHEMAADPPNERVADLLGSTTISSGLGLGSDFMVNVISNVGNYAEAYEHTMEAYYPRGSSLNHLWTEGGLLNSPLYR